MKKAYSMPLCEAHAYQAQQMLAESAGTNTLPTEGSDITYEGRRRQRNAWAEDFEDDWDDAEFDDAE